MVNPSPTIQNHPNDERDEKLDQVPRTWRDQQGNQQDIKQEQEDSFRTKVCEIVKQVNDG